jgi:hypothetical protein
MLIFVVPASSECLSHPPLSCVVKIVLLTLYALHPEESFHLMGPFFVRNLAMYGTRL